MSRRLPERGTLIIRGDRGERFIACRKSRRLIVPRFAATVTRTKIHGGGRLAFADENFRPKRKDILGGASVANELTWTCRYFSFTGECRESYRVERR